MEPAMEAYSENVQGFKVMKLRFSAESKSIHQILWKRHSMRIYSELKPPERTLFVINVPSYCTQDSFRKVFEEFGKVQDVFFHEKPSSDTSELPKYAHFSLDIPVEGFKVAYVVFVTEASVKRAMQASPSKEIVLSITECPVLTGLKKWHQEYNNQFVEIGKLTNEIQSVMQNYDKEKLESEKAAKENEPDEDGWVTVTSTKKKPKLLKANELKQTKKKKKKQVELVKFYAFQHRQTKIDKLAQLRKRFEEDKKRINMMKATRKFKP